MDRITQKIWGTWRKVWLVSLGVVFCLCLPIFLTVAGFVLAFITIPGLLFFTPVQLAILLLDAFLRGTARQLTAAASLRTRNVSHSRRTTGRSLNTKRISLSQKTTLASAHGSPQSFSDTAYLAPNTPTNIYDHETTTGIVGAFVESPIGHTSKEVTYDSRSPLEALSVELLEEIVRHLTNSSIDSLALVSKKFGTQFRFRHVHSGYRYFAIQKFSLIANMPQLGQFTTHMIVHPTFYLPANIQWLQASDPRVAEATCCPTEDDKQRLVARTLQACPRLRSLIWSEGFMQLDPTIPKALQTRLATSLRHLDISIRSKFLKTLNSTSSLLGSVRLTSLTLRHGFCPVSVGFVFTLFSLTTTSLRYVRFVNTLFRSFDSVPDILSKTFEMLSGLRRVDIIKPFGLDMFSIPLAKAGEGFELVVDGPGSPLPDHPLMEGIILSNVTSLVFSHRVISWKFVPGITAMLNAAVNLRIFAWNPCSYLEILPVPMLVAAALTTRTKLISLSIQSYFMTHDQIKDVCEALPNLSHLCVVVDGHPGELSTYSQCFGKLKNLVALDVSVSCFAHESCPCEHEDENEPRVIQMLEGSEIGRLCRFLGSKPPTELKIVRLSWRLFNHSDVQWIGSRDEAMKKLETICGPCESEDEIINKIFDSTSWMTTQ